MLPATQEVFHAYLRSKMRYPEVCNVMQAHMYFHVILIGALMQILYCDSTVKVLCTEEELFLV